MISAVLPLHFGPATATSLAEGGDREWLVADGLGGYASGDRERGAHPPLPRAARRRRCTSAGPRGVGLAGLNAIIVAAGRATQVRLATHEWAGGAVDPKGRALAASSWSTACRGGASGSATWRWNGIGDGPGAGRRRRPQPAGGGRWSSPLEALGTWRDAHGERHAGATLRVEPAPVGLVFEWRFRVRAGLASRPAVVPRRVPHREEARARAQRGGGHVAAGRFTAELDTGDVRLEVRGRFTGGGATRAHRRCDGRRARARARTLCARPASPTPVAARLVLAADTFVVAGPAGPDVVAGYPWFGAWSRDTMTAYEGLFLCTGRADEGRELLRAYAATCRRACSPTPRTAARPRTTPWTRRCGSPTPSTCTSRRPATTTSPPSWCPSSSEVVAAHVRGTRFGIRVDPADGLLAQGVPGYALTWMDARVDGVGVTARAGKAVEIAALWINALAGLRALHCRVGTDPGDLAAGGAGPGGVRAGSRRPAAVCTTWSTGGIAAGTTRRSGPTSCSPTPCPAARCSTPPRSRRSPARCSPRSGCAASRPAPPATAGGTAAARHSVTAPTTRAPCGRG